MKIFMRHFFNYDFVIVEQQLIVLVNALGFIRIQTGSQWRLFCEKRVINVRKISMKCVIRFINVTTAWQKKMVRNAFQGKVQTPNILGSVCNRIYN